MIMFFWGEMWDFAQIPYLVGTIEGWTRAHLQASDGRSSFNRNEISMEVITSFRRWDLLVERVTQSQSNK